MTTSDAVPRPPLVVPAVLVSALSGAFVAVQGRLNGDLSAAGAGALVATWLSYVGTLVTVAVVVALQGRAPATARILRHDAAWWWYAVGLCGVPIVITFALGIPIVGVAVASVCAVAGQTVAGLGLDARGIGVPEPLRPTGRRLVAALVAVAGLAAAVGSGTGSGTGSTGSRVGTATVVGLGVLMFVGGAVLTGQQAGNGRVNLLTGDAVLPALTSSAGGTAGVTLLVALAAVSGGLGGVDLPGPGRWYLYLGGPLGAAITVAAAWAIRHLGTFALTLGVVGGQMLTAVVVDLVGGVGVRWSTVVAVLLTTTATALVVLPRRARVRPTTAPDDRP